MGSMFRSIIPLLITRNNISESSFCESTTGAVSGRSQGRNIVWSKFARGKSRRQGVPRRVKHRFRRQVLTVGFLSTLEGLDQLFLEMLTSNKTWSLPAWLAAGFIKCWMREYKVQSIFPSYTANVHAHNWVPWVVPTWNDQLVIAISNFQQLPWILDWNFARSLKRTWMSNKKKLRNSNMKWRWAADGTVETRKLTSTEYPLKVSSEGSDMWKVYVWGSSDQSPLQSLALRFRTSIQKMSRMVII
jgi:hypothetical protein